MISDISSMNESSIVSTKVAVVFEVTTATSAVFLVTTKVQSVFKGLATTVGGVVS